MSQAPNAVAREGQVVFELERFAATRRDRCVVEGRWYGVRGRRFIRPTLTVDVEGDATRLLADLVDKPWAAEDGERWRATFPLIRDVDEVGRAELSVAPDITITLPGSVDGEGKAKPQTERSERSGRRRRPASPEPELIAAQGDQRRLADQLARTTAEKARTAARMDELLGQLAQVARERDEATAVRDQLIAERDAAERERDAAQRIRDQIAADLDATRSEGRDAAKASDAARVARDRALEDAAAAIAGRRRAEDERDAAVAARDRALAERDGALALRDHALAERSAAVAARDDVVHQRDALARTSERLQSELADVVSTRGAALVMRRAAQERAASHRSTALGPAAMALLALLTIVVVLIVVRAI